MRGKEAWWLCRALGSRDPGSSSNLHTPYRPGLGSPLYQLLAQVPGLLGQVASLEGSWAEATSGTQSATQIVIREQRAMTSSAQSPSARPQFLPDREAARIELAKQETQSS